MKGFREFILRGNVIDLAVAVVIGAAFTAIVGSLVTNIFTPIIGALFDAKDLSKALIVTIPTTSGGTADIKFGAFIAAVINFVIVAAVVYFVFVRPDQRAAEARVPGAGAARLRHPGPADRARPARPDPRSARGAAARRGQADPQPGLSAPAGRRVSPSGAACRP